MMERDRWEQIERLYHAALERGTDAREAFLDDTPTIALVTNFSVPHFSVKAVSQNFVSAYSVSPGIETANNTSIQFYKEDI